jgi:N6-adenosine-specific RNA methylase IME4
VLIERMYPDASRIELFAREEHPNWTAWGAELSVDDAKERQC